MRLLVTGGAGLIGTGVLRALRTMPEVRARIADVRKLACEEAEVLQGDVRDPGFLARAVEGCDAVLHLAGNLGVELTEADYLGCLEGNVQATRELLACCVRASVSRVVIASSSEVYGDAGGLLVETTQVRPKSVYAAAKLACEAYALAYHQRYGLDARIVRFFNVYGPGQRGDFVVPRFVRAVREGAPPRLFGDGSQIRSFCHVDDAARGVVAMVLAPSLPHRIFNIGNGEEPVSMRELAERLIAIAGLKLSPLAIPFQNSDRSATREIYLRIPSTIRAAEALGYTPRITLDTGLRSLFESYDHAASAVPAPELALARAPRHAATGERP